MDETKPDVVKEGDFDTAPCAGSGTSYRKTLTTAEEKSLLNELKEKGYAATAALKLSYERRALLARLHLEGVKVKNADLQAYPWLATSDGRSRSQRSFLAMKHDDLDRDLSKSRARRGRKEHDQVSLPALDLVGCKINRSYSAWALEPEENHKGVTLAGADFRQANLKWTNFWNADLSGAELFETQLQGAQLARVKFGHADVSSAHFRDADLGAADLSGVSGLAADRLAGARLVSTKLPEAVTKFDRLAHANKSVQSANTNIIILVGACLYCWIMIASTIDIDLVASRAGVPLPVVGTSIPLNQFYVVAPLIILSIYIYLQYYLQAIWTDIASLPAVFPDGEPVNEKIDPWLLGVVPRRHVYRLRISGELNVYGKAIYWLTVAIAWGLAPLTILVMWVRFLPAHREFEASALLILFVFSLIVMIYTAWLADATMWDGRSGYRRDPVTPGKDYDSGTGLERKYLMRPRFDWSIRGIATVVAIVMLSGVFVTQQSFLPADKRAALMAWLPLDANLAGAALTSVDLVYRNLRNANLVDANLAGANLREAQLEGARLNGANLTGANLAGAYLIGADLANSRLAGANLTDAKVDGVILDGACGDAATRLPAEIVTPLPRCPSSL